MINDHHAFIREDKDTIILIKKWIETVPHRHKDLYISPVHGKPTMLDTINAGHLQNKYKFIDQINQDWFTNKMNSYKMINLGSKPGGGRLTEWRGGFDSRGMHVSLTLVEELREPRTDAVLGGPTTLSPVAGGRPWWASGFLVHLPRPRFDASGSFTAEASITTGGSWMDATAGNSTAGTDASVTTRKRLSSAVWSMMPPLFFCFW